ncbi:MAG: inosine/xanthosine triphosphatase [Firmicutes bacterium]|nr:inosine/xanthosine triphosphatase [Bacillota bacterium]
MHHVSAPVVAVGSTNPAKAGAAASVMGRAFPGARVVTVAVESGVSRQPMSAAETERGARNRAARALDACPDARYGIGLEGGFEPGAGGGHLVNCCAVAARDGLVAVAWGVRFPLPPAVVERLWAGEELATVMDRLSRTSQSKARLGAVGILTGGLLTREALWEQAIACALIPHLNPDLYRPAPGDRRYDPPAHRLPAGPGQGDSPKT